MKDYVLENLELELGEQLEEILAEAFFVPKEEGVIDYFLEESIYDLSSDSEIRLRIKRDQEFLDEGNAGVEDLKKLEDQAKAYFKNPKRFKGESEDNTDEITGFVQYLAEVYFDEHGVACEKWRSMGVKFRIALNDLYQPELIMKNVESKGVELNELTRIVFYGYPLEKIVGTRIYKPGEKKEIVNLSEQFKSITLAVPDYSDCSSRHPSIFESIDQMIKNEVPYGNELNLDRVVLGHHELTLQCLEEVRQRSIEELKDERVAVLERKKAVREASFDIKFKDAKDIISQLNDGIIRISDIESLEAATLGQVLWLAEKKGNRIDNSIKYFQLKSLFKKKKLTELEELKVDSKSILIDQVNAGYPVEVHLLDFEELDITFAILWGGGARIKTEYKDTYFKLKERYLHLKSIKEAA